MLRLLRIRTGRQPHEIMITVAALIVGVIGVFAPMRIHPAIVAAFGEPQSQLFYAAMAVFSAMVLVSLVHRRIESMLLERAGLLALACFFGAYAGAVLSDRGLNGVMGSIIPACWAIANISRVYQIGYDLKLLRSYLLDHPDEEEIYRRDHG